MMGMGEPRAVACAHPYWKWKGNVLALRRPQKCPSAVITWTVAADPSAALRGLDLLCSDRGNLSTKNIQIT